MKKHLIMTSLMCLAFSPLFSFMGVGTTYAATANTAPVVNMTVNATIAINCPSPVTMGSITGTGQSALTTNSTTCNIKTNNSAGYKLEWTAGTAAMTSGADTIGAYTPAAPNTPETWSVAAAASEWGGHLGSASTTADTTTWGAADTYAGGKWLNVATSAYQIVSRSDETTASGDDEIVYFGSEIGASKWQPTGTYTATVTFTATTL